MSGWKFDADRVIFWVEVASAEEALANGLAVGGQVNEVRGHHCNYFWVRGEGLKFIGWVLGGRVESGVEETRLFFFDCFVTFSAG